MQWRRILLPLGLCILYFKVISQPVTIKYLPEKANMIVRVSLSRIGAKVTWPVFRESAPYKDIMKDSEDSPLKALVNNPAQSGIDLAADFFIVFQNDSAAPREKPEFHVYGHLLDQNLFAAFLKTFLTKDSLYTYGTNKIIFKDEMTFCWNNEVFAISPVKKTASRPDENYDTVKVRTEKERMQAIDRAMKEKRERCFALLTPHPASTYLTDPTFSTVINTPSDITFWMTGNSNPAQKLLKPISQMIKMPASNNKRTAFIDFETGAISMRVQNFLTDSIAQIYSRYQPASQNMELMNKLDKEGLILSMNISFNSDLVKELIAKSGLNEKIKEMKTGLPFDAKQLSGVFKYQLLLAVFKKNDSSATDAITQKLNGYQALLAIPISNTEKFEELKKTASQAWDTLQNGPFGKNLKDFRPVVKYNQHLCVIAISPQTAERYLNQAPDSAGWEWAQQYQQFPFVMNIKIGELLAALKSNRPERSKEVKEQPLAKMFDQLIISGGNFEQGAINTHLELKSTDATENTLKLIFQKLLAPKEK